MSTPRTAVPSEIARRLNDAERALKQIRTAIGPAYSVLAIQAGDGYPAGTGNQLRVSGGDISNPTLAAVMSQGRETHDRISMRVRLIATATEDLLDEVARLNRHHLLDEEYRHERCSGGEGEWADPTCADLAVRQGLCWRCHSRGRRWVLLQRPA